MMIFTMKFEEPLPGIKVSGIRSVSVGPPL